MMDNSYIGGIAQAIASLAAGMKTTMKVFCRKKVTEQYPENRQTLKLPERYRGTLTMTRDSEGNLRCVACGLCQAACPNDTIRIVSEKDEAGKRRLVSYRYDLGSCMFCQLCVNVCTHRAIAFDQEFEHAVYDRSQLIMDLAVRRSSS